MEVFNFRGMGLLPFHGDFGCHCRDQMFFRFDSSSSFIFSCSCYFSGKGTFNVKLHLQQQHGWLYYDIASFSRDVSHMSILIGTCWSPCSHENNLNSIYIYTHIKLRDLWLNPGWMSPFSDTTTSCWLHTLCPHCITMSPLWSVRVHPTNIPRNLHLFHS